MRLFRQGKHSVAFGLSPVRLSGQRKGRDIREGLAKLCGHSVVLQGDLRADEQECGPPVLDRSLRERLGELLREVEEPLAVCDPRRALLFQRGQLPLHHVQFLLDARFLLKILDIGQEVARFVGRGEFELQQTIEPGMAAVQLGLKFLPAGRGERCLRGVRLLQLREGVIKEGLREPKPGEQCRDLFLHHFFARPGPLHAARASLGAVVVDVSLLPLGGDRRTAVTADHHTATEGEQMPAVSSLPPSPDGLLHLVEESFADEWLVLDVLGVQLGVVANGAVVVRVGEQVPDRRFAQFLAILRPQPQLVTEGPQGGERPRPPGRLLEEPDDQRPVNRVHFLAAERPVELQQKQVLVRVISALGDVPVSVDVDVARRDHARVLALEKLRDDVAPDELAGVITALLRHREMDLHHELVVGVVRVRLLGRNDRADDLLVHHVDQLAPVEAVAGETRQVVGENPIGFPALQPPQHVGKERATGLVRRLVLHVDINDNEATARCVFQEQAFLGVRSENLTILSVGGFPAVEEVIHGWEGVQVHMAYQRGRKGGIDLLPEGRGGTWTWDPVRGARLINPTGGERDQPR